METQKPQKRIVYFEDDPDMIELVRIILAREGFQIDGVSEGKAGLDFVRNTQPDLVLLDLMLPDLDGWEVFRQLKQDEATEAIPVMVVTAKSLSIDKVLGIEIAKVDEYISKPFRPQELVELVNRVLAQAEN